MKKILTLIGVLALSAALLVGCTTPPQAAVVPESSVAEETLQATEPAAQLSAEPLLTGGVLCLKINPEIALHYDESGKVTKLEGRNADGTRILKDYTGYAGKETSQVLEELVEIIGKAGYFVEEADGTARRIVLELDPGSQVPHDQFLQDMASHVKLCVENKSWIGEADYEYDKTIAPTEASAQTTAPTQAAASPGKATSEKPSSSGKATSSGGNVPSGLCPTCADDDCNDGKYCDDWDEKAENLREAENRKNGVSCPVCGDYDCDDGKYCDDWDDRYDHHDDHHDWDD